MNLLSVTFLHNNLETPRAAVPSHRDRPQDLGVDRPAPAGAPTCHRQPPSWLESSQSHASEASPPERAEPGPSCRGKERVGEKRAVQIACLRRKNQTRSDTPRARNGARLR